MSKRLTVWRYTEDANIRWCLELNPQDLWVGMYYKSREEYGKRFLDVWICILPCLPIRFEVVIS
jgi:hypothetical protein